MSTSEGVDADVAFDETTRAAARQAVLVADARLQELSRFVDLPDESLPATVLDTLSGGPVGDESPAEFLSRWWSLFQPEIALLHEIRNRVAHHRPVPDSTLAGAFDLSRRIIELTFPHENWINEPPFG